MASGGAPDQQAFTDDFSDDRAPTQPSAASALPAGMMPNMPFAMPFAMPYGAMPGYTVPAMPYVPQQPSAPIPVAAVVSAAPPQAPMAAAEPAGIPRWPVQEYTAPAPPCAVSSEPSEPRTLHQDRAIRIERTLGSDTGPGRGHGRGRGRGRGRARGRARGRSTSSCARGGSKTTGKLSEEFIVAKAKLKRNREENEDTDIVPGAPLLDRAGPQAIAGRPVRPTPS